MKKSLTFLLSSCATLLVAQESAYGFTRFFPEAKKPLRAQPFCTPQDKELKVFCDFTV